MNRSIDRQDPRNDADIRPEPAAMAAPAPAMTESPMPNWPQRNRTPDPLTGH